MSKNIELVHLFAKHHKLKFHQYDSASTSLLFCSGTSCDECNVLAECKNLGQFGRITKNEFNQLKVTYPEYMI
jgi:hypothetical protein